MTPIRPVVLFLVTLALSATANAQKASTPKVGSPDRQAIMDALRPPFEKVLGKPVIFVVRHLKVANGWAYWEGEPKRPGNKPIDYSKTKLAEDYKQGVVDQISLALLQNVKGKWKVVHLAIGPTDYPVEYWQEKNRSAPKSIFPKMG